MLLDLTPRFSEKLSGEFSERVLALLRPLREEEVSLPVLLVLNVAVRYGLGAMCSLSPWGVTGVTVEGPCDLPSKGEDEVPCSNSRAGTGGASALLANGFPRGVLGVANGFETGEGHTKGWSPRLSVGAPESEAINEEAAAAALEAGLAERRQEGNESTAGGNDGGANGGWRAPENGTRPSVELLDGSEDATRPLVLPPRGGCPKVASPVPSGRPCGSSPPARVHSFRPATPAPGREGSVALVRALKVGGADATWGGRCAPAGWAEACWRAPVPSRGAKAGGDSIVVDVLERNVEPPRKG